jgi:Undecaprenyl-phosphate glucose phosphotransferase
MLVALEASGVSLPAHTEGENSLDTFHSTTSRPSDQSTPLLRLPYHFVEPAVIAVDILIVLAASVVSGFAYNWLFLGQVPVVETYTALGVLASVNLCAVLAARGDYRVINLLNFYRQAREVMIFWIGVLLVLIAVAFLLKIGEDFSRGATLTFFVLGFGSMIAWRRLLARSLRRALADGAFARRKVIVIGERNRLAASRTILEMRRCGYTPIQTFEIAHEEFGASRVSWRFQATIDAAIEAARRESVAEILLLIGWEHNWTIESIATMLSVLPIPVYLLPDDHVARYLGNRSINVGAIRAAELQRAPLSRTEQFFKRCVDVIGAASALLLLSPLMLITALLIRLDSPGPVFFFQTRNGFNGRAFRIVKFRTMHVLEDGDTIRQATRTDPRVTQLGRWLRRANIDELPQLFNVLNGEMSLVGPRPHAVAHNTEFEKLVANYAFRHHVKPGITGWAQVNGYRGETPTADVMAKRVEFDLWYINNWSLWTDIRILFRTLIIGLQSSAY